MTREEASALLTEFTRSDSLRKRALAVEAALRAPARRYGEDAGTGGVVGMRHDFDYERYPRAPAHPDDHVAFVIGALEAVASAIGLAGQG
jgi:predicted hydrolase (HD superfamily)